MWPILPSRTAAAMLDLRLNWLPDDDEEIEAAVRTRVGQGPRLGEHRLDVVDPTRRPAAVRMVATRTRVAEQRPVMRAWKRQDFEHLKRVGR